MNSATKITKMSNSKRSVIALISVLVLGFTGFKILGNKSDRDSIYSEYVVNKGSIKIKILSTGIVQPKNKVEIKAPIAGRVEKVLVKEGARVKKGQILAWMSSTERAAMLDAASSKGPQELKDWEEMYRATPILAPINGTIIQKNVESGQTFTTQDAILVMSDRLTVKAQIDETDIAQIKLKQNANITLDAYPEELIAAQVDQIAFDAKTVNNVTTYIADVLPDATPVYMRSGMTANVVFNVQNKDGIIVVPNESIKNIEGRNIVLVPRSKNSMKDPVERELELGLTDGKTTEVKAGLVEGEKILIEQFKIGDKKKGSSSPFSPMGGPPRSRGGK